MCERAVKYKHTYMHMIAFYRCRIDIAHIVLYSAAEDAVDLDKEQFSDTEDEDELGDDDIRFKVFDEKKFKRRRSSVKFPPPAATSTPAAPPK